jgi:hypothetical protein
MENSSKVVLKEIKYEGVNWIQGPVVGSCEYDNEPLSSIKDEEFDQLSIRF